MNRKIKVCHMTSAHKQEDTRIFHKECVSLANAGYDVSLVSVGNNYEKAGVHIFGVTPKKRSRLYRMLVTSRMVYKKALSINADIYHLHDPELLKYGIKLIKKGKLVIFDSHEFVVGQIREKTYIPLMLRGIVSKAFEKYQKKACLRFSAVIAANPDLGNYFKSIGCKVVTSICNYPLYSPNNYQTEHNRSELIYAGGINSQWNHEYLLDAIDGLPVKYVLCGTADDEYLSKLKKYPAWENTDYFGSVPFGEVQEKLRSAGIGIALLSPGLNTNGKRGNLANTKIFEEMQAGIPVICTDFEVWKEFVERYNCGICVDPKNTEQIRSAVERLLYDHELAQRMGMNGQKAIAEEFNWNFEGKKLLELYNTILS